MLANTKRGLWLQPPLLTRVPTLLHVNRLAVGVKRALNADLLAFVLLQPILPVDVKVLAAGILQNVLVARLHNCAAEGLAVIGRLGGLGVIAALTGRRLLLLRRWRAGGLRLVRLLRVQGGGTHGQRERAEHPKSLRAFLHEVLRRSLNSALVLQTRGQRPPYGGMFFGRVN